MTKPLGAYAVLQNDGNFVVRNSSGGALWSTDTWDRGTDYEVGGFEFVVQDDGNLVMYDGWYQYAWASNSCCNPAGGSFANCEVTTCTPNYSNLDWNIVYAAYYSAFAISCAELCAQSRSADPASRCNSYSWWPPASGNGICYFMISHPTTVSTVAGVYSGHIRGRSTL
ncbi:MAG TPA: hypothetical protein VKP30_30445 [Polyangiaceae bacterium]|nr:hypothetical protein [Polyangiaceae bacterium]